MSKPTFIQTLKHGKVICKKIFPNFVQTWNWMTSAVSGLKGDYDVDARNGRVSVDWSRADEPVIRLMSSGAGGSCKLRVNTDGNNGSTGDVTIGEGDSTNKITFASEDDSNVKFTVTKTDANSVQVKIGVYYK